jgi:histidine phosphotransferase ChpT
VLQGDTSGEIAPRAAAAWLVQSLVEEGGGELQLMDEEEGVLLIGAGLKR